MVENRPGAGTTIGTEYVAKSAPDGYTLLMVSGTQTVNETLYTQKAYHLMSDLVPMSPLIDCRSGAGGEPVSAGEKHGRVDRFGEGQARHC